MRVQDISIGDCNYGIRECELFEWCSEYDVTKYFCKITVISP